VILCFLSIKAYVLLIDHYKELSANPCVHRWWRGNAKEDVRFGPRTCSASLQTLKLVALRYFQGDTV